MVSGAYKTIPEEFKTYISSFLKKIDHNSIFEKKLYLVKTNTENDEKCNQNFEVFLEKMVKFSSCSNIIEKLEKHV